MTVDQMRKAGEITNQNYFSDEELAQAIEGLTLTLAFLEGKGPNWALATNPIRRELGALEQMLDNRKARSLRTRNFIKA
jgi:hypothetical protein